jgi:flagellar basal-body rod protein FlgG
MTRYTRNGEFTLNTQGELVLSAGNGRWRVLDRDNAPIQIDRAAGEIKLSPDGTIRQNLNPVAVIGLVSTDDLQSLRKVGENLFQAADDKLMAPIKGRMVPEAREASNFDMMLGLSSMIEGTRAYQLNATMLQLQDQSIGRAINTVGRVT